MTSATATAGHRHQASYEHPISTNAGVELGTCKCGTKVCRQLREGDSPASARTEFIPRDWDAAHEEATAEDEQRAADAAELVQHEKRIADRSATEGLIRDLYAIAAFYSANPEHPPPRYITLGAGVPAADVQAHADQWCAGHVYGKDHQQCDHTLDGTSVRVNFIISAHGSDRPL